MNKMQEEGEKCPKPSHQNRPMKLMCMSESCGKNTLCILCLSEGHAGHQMILFKEKTKYSLQEKSQDLSKWMPDIALNLTKSNERLSQVNVECQNYIQKLEKKISTNLQEMQIEYQRQAEEIIIETHEGIAQISAVPDQIENTFISECDKSGVRDNISLNINNSIVDQKTIFSQKHYQNLLVKNQNLCSELATFKICLHELIEANRQFDSIRGTL